VCYTATATVSACCSRTLEVGCHSVNQQPAHRWRPPRYAGPPEKASVVVGDRIVVARCAVRGVPTLHTAVALS
jgi:hypothetical protein